MASPSLLPVRALEEERVQGKAGQAMQHEGAGGTGSTGLSLPWLF